MQDRAIADHRSLLLRFNFAISCNQAGDRFAISCYQVGTSFVRNCNQAGDSFAVSLLQYANQIYISISGQPLHMIAKTLCTRSVDRTTAGNRSA
jgi:hypothetical protein